MPVINILSFSEIQRCNSSSSLSRPQKYLQGLGGSLPKIISSVTGDNVHVPILKAVFDVSFLSRVNAIIRPIKSEISALFANG